MKARPTQSRGGVKGQLPLAGSRDSVPCGVWGNAPTVPRATSMPNALNKGAGSEASLPVTLRVRRRAPKLLFPQDSVKSQKRPQAVKPAVFACCGVRLCAETAEKPCIKRFSGIEKAHRNSIKITVNFWRRVRDLNPRWGISPHTISSRAP